MIIQKLTALSNLKGKKIKNIQISMQDGSIILLTKKHAFTFSVDDKQGIVQVERKRINKKVKEKQ